MGKVCVAGAGEVVIDYGKGTLTWLEKRLKEGDAISINGSTAKSLPAAFRLLTVS